MSSFSIDTNKDEYITKDELQRLEEADPEEVAKATNIDIKDLTTFKRGVNVVGKFILTNKEDQLMYYERYCIQSIFFCFSNFTLKSILIFSHWTEPSEHDTQRNCETKTN